jgi:hypothetical protein
MKTLYNHYKSQGLVTHTGYIHMSRNNAGRPLSMTQTVGLLLGWGLVRYDLLPFIQNHAQVHSDV